MLLAYYIAAVNIETVYHELRYGSLSTNAPYETFEWGWYGKRGLI